MKFSARRTMSKSEERDYSESSDDEDYKPENEENCAGSEDDSDVPEDGSDSSEGEKSKRKSTGKKPRKKRRKKASTKEDSDGDDNEKSLTAEEEKRRSDQLWADFLSDVDPPPAKAEVTRKSPTPKISKPKSSEESKTAEERQKEQKLPIVEEIFNFAGEEVKVPVKNAQKPAKRPAVPAVGRSSGVSSILGSLGKKPKISTLEKTKLDWNRFKESEGINEELERFNKGKDGYLERQDFLERTDYRQFDLERDMRQKKRSSR